MSQFTNQNAFRTIVGAAGMMICTIACLSAATADAQPIDRPARSQAVGTADLNLTTEEGRLVLDRRLKRAAEQVCASDQFYAASDNAARKRCARAAMETALPSINRALDLAKAG